MSDGQRSFDHGPRDGRSQRETGGLCGVIVSPRAKRLQRCASRTHLGLCDRQLRFGLLDLPFRRNAFRGQITFSGQDTARELHAAGRRRKFRASSGQVTALQLNEYLAGADLVASRRQQSNGTGGNGRTHFGVPPLADAQFP